MIEQRLREAADAWFPATPAVAEDVRRRLPRTRVEAGRRPRTREVVAVALLVALALAATAVAASWLELVPGVRTQQVDRLPEVGYVSFPFGAETTLERAQETLPFEVALPSSLGEPSRLHLDRDQAGAPVLTAVYGGVDSARVLLTQWPATVVLFDKLVPDRTTSEFVDVHGAAGIWIEGGDHIVFFLGRNREHEESVPGYLAGNVLVWQRGRMSYRLELGGTREQALELAGSLRSLR